MIPSAPVKPAAPPGPYEPGTEYLTRLLIFTVIQNSTKHKQTLPFHQVVLRYLQALCLLAFPKLKKKKVQSFCNMLLRRTFRWNQIYVNEFIILPNTGNNKNIGLTA